MRVLVLGSTGYTGMMLLRILMSHPTVTSVIAASRSAAGEPIAEMDPALDTRASEVFDETDGRYVSPDKAGSARADVVFSALPHKTAAEILAPLVGTVPVIDLSADFRFRSADAYERWYTKHPRPDLLARSVYGLSEWHRGELKTADLVACPGCYPTCILLPLLPFTGCLDGPVLATALTGLSGAGRKEKQNLLFNEVSENMAAYSPGRQHRHVPEIEQELGAHGIKGEVLFTPHLVPVKQGMFATITVELKESLAQSEAEARIAEAYEESPFVRLSSREVPQTRDVRNTNRCDIAVRVEGKRLMLFSVIDNLYKGASGQAVQNLNIRFGLPESAGLSVQGEF